MMTIRATKQGQHSTDVDLCRYVSMLEEALISEPISGTLQLQVRPVQIRRRTRNPGIHAIGYEVHAPNSIEVLLFNNEPTGRPATLCLPSEDTFAAALLKLSPRLHGTWKAGWERNYKSDLGYVVVGQFNKFQKRGLNKGSANDLLKAALSQIRSYYKSNALAIAYDLLGTKSHGPLTTKGVLDVLGLGKTNESVLVQPLVHFIEQCGLIEVRAPFSSITGLEPVVLTEYCLDLAQQYVDGKNADLRQKWEDQEQNLLKEVGRDESQINELERRIEAQRKKFVLSKQALESHRSKSVVLIKIPYH